MFCPGPPIQSPPVLATSTKTHLTEAMAKPDPYADVDFDELTESTGLAVDEIKCLKVGRDTPGIWGRGHSNSSLHIL